MEQINRKELMQATVRAIDHVYEAKFADRDTYSLVAIANAMVVIADCLDGIDKKLDAIAQAHYS